MVYLFYKFIISAVKIFNKYIFEILMKYFTDIIKNILPKYYSFSFDYFSITFKSVWSIYYPQMIQIKIMDPTSILKVFDTIRIKLKKSTYWNYKSHQYQENYLNIRTQILYNSGIILTITIIQYNILPLRK